MASQDLQWLLVRPNSSFIVKQKGIGRIFTREPANLTQLHSYKYCGLVNAKSVSVDFPTSGKGVSITTRNSKKGPLAVKASQNTSSLKKGGGRRTAGAVSNIVAKKNYRADLTKAAVVRASAILRSQRARSQPPARLTRGSGARKVVKVQPTTA